MSGIFGNLDRGRVYYKYRVDFAVFENVVVGSYLQIHMGRYGSLQMTRPFQGLMQRQDREASCTKTTKLWNPMAWRAVCYNSEVPQPDG